MPVLVTYQTFFEKDKFNCTSENLILLKTIMYGVKRK